MSTATTEVSPPTVPLAGALDFSEKQDDALTKQLIEDARIGAEKLLRMPPAELRELIASRVKMLKTELSERGERRAAIEEAMNAQRVLDARRQRARRVVRRKVNIGTSLTAATFGGLIFVSMFSL
jgi:hypothetical protein